MLNECFKRNLDKGGTKMFEDSEKLRQISKWIIGIFTVCSLIFLGIRHINKLANAIIWIATLTKPLCIGVILALFLNVPLGFIEKHLFINHPSPVKQKMRRPLSILMAIVFVLGVFIGVAFLVIPELIDAVVIVVDSVTDSLDKLVELEKTADYSKIPFGDKLALIDIDFSKLKTGLNGWMRHIGTSIMDIAAAALGSIASLAMDYFIGLIFSIYILANKEGLKRQICKLIRVWLPQKLGDSTIHIASVCSKNFKLFVAGQTTEAAILGSLCVIGMLILRIPYAPTISALVGVTALIPYVGSLIATFVGVFMIMTVNPFKAFVFLVFLLTLQQVEGNAIYPKVVGAKINLPAIWVLAAITIGGNLAGPIGMLLGVPAASSAYTLLREATEKREAQISSKENTISR